MYNIYIYIYIHVYTYTHMYYCVLYHMCAGPAGAEGRRARERQRAARGSETLVISSIKYYIVSGGQGWTNRLKT